MSKFFRKKPGVIEAMQFDGTEKSANEISFLFDHSRKNTSARTGIVSDGNGNTTLNLRSDHGWVTCSKGEWVIRGASGELYPCSADKFAEIYEPAEEE